MKLCSIVKLCRIEHWVKNILVLMPPFFLGALFDRDVILSAIPAFLSFSFVASAVYVINDIVDRERDRVHPVKCNRPIASGVVGICSAICLIVVLCALGGWLLVYAHSVVYSGMILGIYLLSNIAYSIRFKHTPLVDIFLLASGFVFRVFYGGAFFGVKISSWLFLCVFSGALYFACGKRKNEIVKMGTNGNSRVVLKFYSQKFLDSHYYMFCGLSILFYCLWTISRTNQHAVGKLALTIPVMVFILTRYNYIIESNKSDGDPVPVLMHDRWLIFAVSIFIILNSAILYLRPGLIQRLVEYVT